MDSSDSNIVDQKIGTCIGDRYRLDQRLAAGGMGVVYRGECVDDGSAVAVKFLHEMFTGQPALVKRFEREVAAMGRLSHPNLIDIIDSGVSGGVPYLVMNFHAGRALSEILEQGPLELSRAIGIALQLLSGVAHAHASGVVHRDLKPDNILLFSEEGQERAKILDFGLAKLMSLESGGTQLTNTGFALGTPGYMSPEQARGTPTDERTDLYAVGVVLYQMIVGRKPFVADSPMAVLRMHMDDTPIAPRKAAPERRISANLDRAIVRVLEKDPKRRWQTAAKFAAALKATKEGAAYIESLGGVSTTTVGHRFKVAAAATRRATKSWLLPRRRLRSVGTLALLLVGAVGTLTIWNRLHRQERQQVQKTIGGAVGVAKEAFKSLAEPSLEAWSRQKKSLSGVLEQAQQTFEHSQEQDADDEDAGLTNEAETPGKKLEVTSTAHEASHLPTSPRRIPRIEDAVRLLSANHVDDAILQLYRIREKAPHSAAVALLLGHAYFRKNWRTDGLREYAAALQLRPPLRNDRLLEHNVISALDDPTWRIARTFVRRRLGSSALGELRRAARDPKNPKIKERATKLVSEIAPRRR